MCSDTYFHDIKKKNDIAVDTVASTAAGVVTSAVIDIVLASNPVGWGIALLLAVGTAAVSYAAGKGAVTYYNGFGHPVNFVHKLDIDKLCHS